MRRVHVGGITLLLTWVALVAWSIRPSHAAPVSQIVQPGDVATPTPTYAIILMPTATPMPTVNAGQSNTLATSAGFHNNTSFTFYTVQPGDTLLEVAVEVGVDVQELPCAVAPDFRPDQPLVIGNRLEAPPAGWRCHKITAGDTLTQIAAQYGVDPIAILDVSWNRLDAGALGDNVLPSGAYLRIPPVEGDTDGGGFLAFMLEQPLDVSPMTAYAIGGPRAKASTVMGPLPKEWPYGSGNFMWPVYGWLSQAYRDDHRAIDIAAPTGTFVTAADRGVVIRAGWNDQGYGMFVVIDHNIDYITLYAHLDDVYVREGEIVEQGQVLGVIGSSGNSTGPHLHFEIRDFGRRANPLDFLMR